MPVRQWVLSFPIPLHYLFAAPPQLLSPVLQVVNRAVSTFLIKQAGLKRPQAATGAVTLIQRFTTLGPLQSAACIYRLALGPRAGQKVLTLQRAHSHFPGQAAKSER